MKTYVRVYGILLSVAVVLLLGFIKIFPQRDCAPGECGVFTEGFKMPVIALELVRTGADLRSILSSAECLKQQDRALYFDSFIFIPFYASSIFGLCWLLIHSRPAIFKKIGLVALGTGALGVVFDYTENHFMCAAINWGRLGNADFPDSMARDISYPSMTKWVLVFLSVALLAALFFRMGRLGAVIAFCFIASFGIILYGVGHFRPAIESVVLPLAPAELLIMYLFVFRPDEVVTSLTSGSEPAGPGG